MRFLGRLLLCVIGFLVLWYMVMQFIWWAWDLLLTSGLLVLIAGVVLMYFFFRALVRLLMD